MSKPFDRDVDRAAEDLSRMAHLVEDALRAAVTALEHRDRVGAEGVAAGDHEIDHLENQVDQQCTRILALHHPVAGDLRRVIALMHAAGELERMGDLAKSIAERAVRLLDLPPVSLPARLLAMAGRASAMVHAGLDAFLRRDAVLAREVRRQDDAVDADNAAVIQELIGRMREDPDAVEPGLCLFTTVRHLERVADHATNIAGDAVFWTEGEVLKHRHETAVSIPCAPQPVSTVCL